MKSKSKNQSTHEEVVYSRLSSKTKAMTPKGERSSHKKSAQKKTQHKSKTALRARVKNQVPVESTKKKNSTKRKSSKVDTTHPWIALLKSVSQFPSKWPARWFQGKSPAPLSMLIMLVATGIVVLWTGMMNPGTRGPASVTYSPNAELQSIFRMAEKMPLGERVNLWSDRLRDNPRLLSWLEDASSRVKNDNAPYIPEAFDCTTFVETVAALARSRSAYEVADQILAIRYKDGEPSYFNRNHFPEADWIPNNEKANILKDITREIADLSGIHSKVVFKDILKRKWILNQPDSPVSRMPASSPAVAQIPERIPVRLDYIPLDQVNDAVDYIPHGAIINIVHVDHPRKPVLISHQGFFVRKNGKTYFRHAKRTHGIKDSDFSSYMRSQKTRTWQVVGINVNSLQLK